MKTTVSAPIGKLIKAEQDTDGKVVYELRYHDGHVFGYGLIHFGRYARRWNVTDFGIPERAKRVYTKLAVQIDEVCQE